MSHACVRIHLPNTILPLSVPSCSMAADFTCVHWLGTQSSEALSLSSLHLLTIGRYWGFLHCEPGAFGFQLSVPKTNDTITLNEVLNFSLWYFHSTKAMMSKMPGIITEMRTLPPYFLKTKSIYDSSSCGQFLKTCTYKCPSCNCQFVIPELQCC